MSWRARSLAPKSQVYEPTSKPRPSCTVCRYSKTRCDRAEPTCGRCARLRQTCEYESLPSRTSLPRQIMRLQARLARAEARLAIPDHEVTGQSSLVVGRPVTPPPTTEGHASAPALPDLQAASLSDPMLNAGGSDKDWWGSDFGLSNIEGLDTFDNTLFAVNLSTEWPDMTPMFSPFASLPSRQSSDGPTSTQTSVGADSTQSHSIRFHFQLSQEKFFQDGSPSMPIINRRRFEEEAKASVQSSPTQALSNATALLGAVASDLYHDDRGVWYRDARQALDICEREDEGSDAESLSYFQALLLVIRYEILGKRLTKACITLGRAIQLARLLDLTHLDASSSTVGKVGSEAATDPGVCEEWRRSFWFLVTLENYITNRTAMDSQLGFAHNFDVRLPAPGEPGDSSSPSPTIATVDDSPFTGLDCSLPLSSYACSVLMVDLAARSFSHSRNHSHDFGGKGFWDRHCELVKDVEKALCATNPLLGAVCHDPLSFSTHINMQAVEIFLHDTAIREMEQQNLPVEMGIGSRQRCSKAALSIVNTIRLVQYEPRQGPSLLKTQAVCLAWPIVMAMRALGRDLASTSTSDSPANVAESIRLLLATLEYVEGPGNFWSAYAEQASSLLRRWDESHSGLYG